MGSFPVLTLTSSDAFWAQTQLTSSLKNAFSYQEYFTIYL